MARESTNDEDLKTNIEAEYRELYSDRVGAIRSSQSMGTTTNKEIPLHLIDFLHDVRLKLMVEFGHAKLTLGDVLNLKKNSLIMVEKYLGEPVEIFAGGALIARGEVVIVNDRLGIRLTEIVRPEETSINATIDDIDSKTINLKEETEKRSGKIS